MGVGKMTEGRLFHTKHALGFGREPEQGGSEHERVYRKITANAASTVYDGFNPRRSNHGGLLFMRGLTPFPPPVFTGFKFSNQNPLITGLRYPIITSEPSPSRGGAARSEARTRPLERHAYKYPMGVGKMTEGRLFHTKHALDSGGNRSREVASMSACIARSQRMPHRPCTTVLTPVVVITGFTFYEGVYPLSASCVYWV